MSAEVVVTNNNVTVSTNNETIEDVKNVILQPTNVTCDSTVMSADSTTEPLVPFKSSSEILSELFGAFNAEPPTIPDTFVTGSDENLSSNTVLPVKDVRVSKKTKTPKVDQKLRHKHKHQKHKKKRKKDSTRHDSSSIDERSCSPLVKRIKKEKEADVGLGLELDLNPSPPNVSHKSRQRPRLRPCSPPVVLDLNRPIKKEKLKVKHRKKSRLKIPLLHDGSSTTRRSVEFNQDSHSSGRLGVGLSIKISNNITFDGNSNVEAISKSESQSQSVLSTKKINCSSNIDLKQFENIVATKIKVEPGTEPPSLEGQTSAVNKETCIGAGQSKSSHKISIKNLKNSSVFEATVREVEEQAKAKADKYEEGEISNSDSEEFVISPSDESDGSIATASHDGFYNSRVDQSRSKKHKKKHHSTDHHHLSKHKRKSSGSGKKNSDLSTHSHKKHKRRKEIERRGIKELRCKHRQTNIDSAKVWKKRCSCSLSPERALLQDMPIENCDVLDVPGTSFQNSYDTLRKRSKVRSKFSEKKTVKELTDFCKELSKKEFYGKSDEEDFDSDSESEQPFRHPFQVREKPQSIIVNIRNSIQLPVKSLQEKAAEQTKQLRNQFPVSSGQRHRKAEDEWVPVSPKRDCTRPSTAKHASKPIGKDTVPPVSVLNAGLSPGTSTGILSVDNSRPKANSSPALGTVPSVAPVKDIGSIVSQKLRAMRNLQENPNDVEALGAMFRANKDMMQWAEAKQHQMQSPAVPITATPVAATGSVGISSGGVGMGMSLLQKMGWKPGEGLGKNREGTLEPLKLEIKMDKKGLITAEDLKPPLHPVAASGAPRAVNSHVKFPARNIKQTSVKHPINQLVELCMRNHWRGPQFELCHESGPDHRKNFLFKVVVNGTEYKPMVTNLTKKQAKSEAASVCLQALRDLRQ